MIIQLISYWNFKNVSFFEPIKVNHLELDTSLPRIFLAAKKKKMNGPKLTVVLRYAMCCYSYCYLHFHMYGCYCWQKLANSEEKEVIARNLEVDCFWHLLMTMMMRQP